MVKRKIRANLSYSAIIIIDGITCTYLEEHNLALRTFRKGVPLADQVPRVQGEGGQGAVHQGGEQGGMNMQAS